MKKTDFFEITEEHKRTCQEIIKLKGECLPLDCLTCPLDEGNTVSGEFFCFYNLHPDSEISKEDLNGFVISCAKEFLELTKEETCLDQ